MTRINLVPVEQLSDVHLRAEYYELPRISKRARRAPEAPDQYVRGTGHMLFFYDKGEYLRRRFEEKIVPEMQRRGFKTNFTKYRMHPEGLNLDWTPSPEEVKVSEEWLALKTLEINQRRNTKNVF